MYRCQSYKKLMFCLLEIVIAVSYYIKLKFKIELIKYYNLYQNYHDYQ